MELVEDPRYDDTMVSFHRRRDFAPLAGFFELVRDVETAQTCVAIGAGAGEHDLTFIKHCLPNLKEITAIDPNSKSCGKFQTVLRSEFPDLKTHINVSRCEDWEGPLEPVDAILAFHVLYYVNAADRKKLYHNCLQKWLKPTGKMIILMGEETSFISLIGEKHLPRCRPNQASSQLVTSELKVRGYNVEKIHPYKTSLDLSDLDDDFLRIFQYAFPEENIDLESLKATIMEMYPDSNADEAYELLIVSK